MNTTKTISWILVSWATLAVADGKVALQPKHFRFTRTVQTSEGTGLFRIDIPEGVYSGVAHDDLRDVRVFNHDGIAVPSSFQRSGREETFKTETKVLKFYPVLGEASKTYVGASRVAMTESAAGRSVVVQFGDAAKGGKAVARGYLIDLEGSKEALRRLELDWKEGAETGFFTVRAEGSDDLSTWTLVAAATTLARFQFGGSRLERKTVELPDVRTKYLLLTWSEGPTLPLQAIRGEFAQSAWIEPKRHETPVVARQGENSREFLFEKTPVLADQLMVKLPQINTMVRVSLESRADEKATWRSRAEGLLYRIKTDGREVTSQPLTFPPTPDRFWRLSLVGADSSLGATAPEVEFRWIAHQLFFLAQGNGPFVLAYGQPAAEAADFGLTSVTGDLNGSDEKFAPTLATLGAEVGQTATAPSVVITPADETAATKKYALWAILVGALLLTSFMAWKLVRDLKTQS